MKLYQLIILILIPMLILGCTEEPADTTVEELDEIVVAEENDEPIVPEQTPEEIPEELETPSEPIEEPTLSETHTVKILKTGFEPNELSVNVGDTVEWINEREGTLNKAQIIGSRQCTSIRGPILLTGESYSYTFEEEEECLFVDAITVNQIMTVTVE